MVEVKEEPPLDVTGMSKGFGATAGGDGFTGVVISKGPVGADTGAVLPKEFPKGFAVSAVGFWGLARVSNGDVMGGSVGNFASPEGTVGSDMGASKGLGADGIGTSGLVMDWLNGEAVGSGELGWESKGLVLEGSAMVIDSRESRGDIVGGDGPLGDTGAPWNGEEGGVSKGLDGFNGPVAESKGFTEPDEVNRIDVVELAREGETDTGGDPPEDKERVRAEGLEGLSKGFEGVDGVDDKEADERLNGLATTPSEVVLRGEGTTSEGVSNGLDVPGEVEVSAKRSGLEVDCARMRLSLRGGTFGAVSKGLGAGEVVAKGLTGSEGRDCDDDNEESLGEGMEKRPDVEARSESSGRTIVEEALLAREKTKRTCEKE